jgi:hypothetical protein
MHNVHLFLLAKKASKALGHPMVLAGIVGISALSGLQRSTADVAERRNHAQSFRIFAPTSLRRRLRIFCSYRFPPFKEARLSNRRRDRSPNVGDQHTHGSDEARIVEHVSSSAAHAGKLFRKLCSQRFFRNVQDIRDMFRADL